MNISRISASVRFSNGSKGGPFTTIELDAEAALSPTKAIDRTSGDVQASPICCAFEHRTTHFAVK